MAYYKVSQVIKMRREAMEHDRFAYDVDGPSAMTVFRLEKGEVRVKEKTYRSLSKAMGEEESTRQAVLRTKKLRVLHLVNDISHAFLIEDYEMAEALITQLEEQLDSTVKRNRQYVEYVKAELQYYKGNMEADAFEKVIKRDISYGTLTFDDMIGKAWPFHQMECGRLLQLMELVRDKKEYELQKYLLEQFQGSLERGYMETEYRIVYMASAQWRICDVLGNLGYHREAIELGEENRRMCEEHAEFRYLAEIYYDIFWNYKMLKKKETLTEQEEARCKECLLKAYFINTSWFHPKKLYETSIKECYPEELIMS